MARPRANAFDQKTTERLLSAAVKEFGFRGFDGARLEDIAGAAGIRRPSLLYHFKTKEALYRVTVERVFAQFSMLITAAFHGHESLSPDKKMEQLAEQFHNHLHARPDIAQFVIREMVCPRTEESAQCVSERMNELITQFEHFLNKEAKDEIRADYPIREAVMTVGSAILVRAAQSPKQASFLWGEQAHFSLISKFLHFKAK